MNGIVARRIIILFSASILLSGCSEGQAPFKIVQLCLAGPQEVPAFVAFMDQIAQDREMTFTDRSGATEAELRAVANDKILVAHPHVNIGADRNSDFSFGAGNLGLPTRQIAIGFNGSKPGVARQFAAAAVAQLETRWQIYEVPQGRGARPLRNCN